MGYIKISLDNELANKFREAAMRKYGYTRGAISIAGREAIELWLKRSEMEKARSLKLIRRIALKNLRKIEREAKSFRRSFRLRR